MNSRILLKDRSPDRQDQMVPARYRGVWQRTLLQTPELHDTATKVFWMQTSRWHADIRIPDSRPDFSGVAGLDECNSEQLSWMASQQGFAGITAVKEAASLEICTWHRILDFQPPSRIPDAGYMQFQADKLVETGVHADYLENWVHLPDSDNGFAVLERMHPATGKESAAELLLVAGDHVMHIKDRKYNWPSGIVDKDSFLHLAALNKGLLEMQISFGKRNSSGWEIQHSTMPWLENAVIPLTVASQDAGQIELDFEGKRSYWRKLEWTFPV